MTRNHQLESGRHTPHISKFKMSETDFERLYRNEAAKICRIPIQLDSTRKSVSDQRASSAPPIEQVKLMRKLGLTTVFSGASNLTL